MEQLINILLIIHITFGTTALMAAPVAMLVKKGSTYHRKAGKVFFWSMTAVIATAIVISLYKFIPFLLMIAALSYYSVVSGYRALYLKDLHKRNVVKPIDWVALSINTIANLVFIIWGLTLFPEQKSLGILALVFGGVGLLLSVTNLVRFIKRPPDKMYWLYAHIGGFMGGYIATMTAFSVTALKVVPGIWGWLWPTMIFAPVISVWIAYYKKKFRSGAKPAELLVLK